MQHFTITELWHHMGLFARLVVYVLGIMSISSIFVMAERLVSFRKSNRDSRLDFRKETSRSAITKMDEIDMMPST